MKQSGLVLLAVATLVAPRLLAAQAAPAPPKVRLWSLSWTFGDSNGNTTAPVEAALRAGGFGDTQACVTCRSGASRHPVSSGGGITSAFTVRRELGRSTHVQLVSGTATTGVSFGYKAARTPDDARGTSAVLEQFVNNFALLGGVRWKSLWLAAGPEYNSIHLDESDDDDGSAWHASRLGASVAAGLNYPSHRRGFIQLRLQQHFIGSFDVGAIEIPANNEGTGGTLPPFKLSFNHRVWLIGGGFRI